MKHLKELKIHGIDMSRHGNDDKHMVDPYFEGARTKIQELAQYFEMDDKLLMEMIWNGANDMGGVSEKSSEMIGSMAYTFGLI